MNLRRNCKMKNFISKTKISKRIYNKKNPEVVDTIVHAKKNNNWLDVARTLSRSTREYSSINLREIDKDSKEGETIAVLGKVLGTGNLNKKLRICALSFSESAKEKIKNSKSDAISLIEEIKKNPSAKGVKIIK
jgi:large subunit ribosomal protein L18e